MKEDTLYGSIEALAKVLGKSPIQVGIALDRRGIRTESDKFMRQDLWKLIDVDDRRKAATDRKSDANQAAVKERYSEISALFRIVPTVETGRQDFRNFIEEQGAKNTDRTMKRGALMSFELKNGKTINILTYAAMKLNTNNQIGFSVNHLKNDKIDWVALIAEQPLKKTFIVRMSDLRKKYPRQTAEGRPINITVGAGTPDDNLLSNRLEEILSGE